MAEVKWVKLKVDMFDNRKIKYLRTLPEGNNIVLIWVMLLTMAGRCNSGGMIFLTENVLYTPKMLSDELGFSESVVQIAITALEKLSMISTDENVLCIPGWEEYQNAEGLEKIRESNRKRQKNWYDRNKELSAEISAAKSAVKPSDAPNANPNVRTNVTPNVSLTGPSISISNISNSPLSPSLLDNTGVQGEKKAVSLPAPVPESPVQEPPVLEILTNTGAPYPITSATVAQFQSFYPAVDVLSELRKAAAWSLANPRNRKTTRGMMKFLNGWLSRAQDKAPKAQGARTPPLTPRERAAREEEERNAQLARVLSEMKAKGGDVLP